MSEEITAAAVRILGTEEELLPALCTAAEAGLRARLRRSGFFFCKVIAYLANSKS